MDDYDDIRTCCTGAKLCTKCWTFMKAAIKTIDRAMREDFGFKHLVFVYSGRRGVHCWVSDKAARQLTDEQRSAVAGYMTVVAGGAGQTKADMNLRCDEIHPALEGAHDVCLQYFRDNPEGVLLGQDILRQGPHLERILDTFQAEERSKIEAWVKGHPNASSRDIWLQLEQLQKERTNSAAQGGYKDRAAAKTMLKEIVLQYTYPRLDIAVSKQMNHLLKSPFVVHPKTGRVCVPIDIATVDSFNPLEVPTIGRLVDELNRSGDAKETSLKQYTNFFDTKFLQPLEAQCLKEMDTNGGLDF